MAIKKWTLTDVQNQIDLKQTTIGPDELGDRCVVEKRRLRGGLSAGVDVVRVDNGTLAFEVLPTRGMNLWKAWIGGREIGWKSPVRGPVHPQFVPLMEPGGLGWLDGFDELLARCGLESNGAPDFDDDGRLKFPLHGRIANRPAQKVEIAVDDQSGDILLSGEVEETRFHFLKVRLKTTIVTRPGAASLEIRDEVENLSGSPAEIQMLYHTNFGEPLLDAGSQFIAPLKTVVPRNAHAAAGIGAWNSYAAPVAGFEEQVYFLELLAGQDDRTRTLLKNAHGTRGVSILHNVGQLPCYTVWKNTTASADGYVTGLEPATNFPNPRTFEGKHDRVAKIEAAGSVRFDLALEFHETAVEVEAAEADVSSIQGGTQPQVFDRPQPDWCAP